MITIPDVFYSVEMLKIRSAEYDHIKIDDDQQQHLSQYCNNIFHNSNNNFNTTVTAPTTLITITTFTV